MWRRTRLFSFLAISRMLYNSLNFFVCLFCSNKKQLVTMDRMFVKQQQQDSIQGYRIQEKDKNDIRIYTQLKTLDRKLKLFSNMIEKLVLF